MSGNRPGAGETSLTVTLPRGVQSVERVQRCTRSVPGARLGQLAQHEPGKIPPNYDADEFANDKPRFNANDATIAMLNARHAHGHTAQSSVNMLAVLRDFEDIGYIRHVGRDGENGPFLYEWCA